MFAITVTKGVQDPDFFWHITAGKLIAQTGQVPSTDPFSFTWFGKPWTPHEWLSELLIYWLVTGLGRIGALFVFGLFPAAIFSPGRCVAPGVSVLALALPFRARRPRDDRLRHAAAAGHQLAAAGALIWFLLELGRSGRGASCC